jgi:hypothetical protein
MISHKLARIEDVASLVCHLEAVVLVGENNLLVLSVNRMAGRRVVERTDCCRQRIETESMVVVG